MNRELALKIVDISKIGWGIRIMNRRKKGRRILRSMD